MATAPEPVFSVSEFLDLVIELLGQRDFEVQGEVTGAKSHPTGFYFSLKDERGGGLMDCYMSPYAYRGAGIALEDGMLVKVGGIASIYKPKGRFSFRVQTIQLAGEGSLKKAYEALKKKLTEEGLFDRKRALPEFISRVGLITSRTGAVIDDFRRNLAPLGLSVLHYDVRVEGAQAVPQVKRALEWFGRHAERVDALVLVRGGGSMEDLQAFNDEYVVRGVFGSRVPTVVSIGHDRDVPLAQMAADASASTPTATAHVINASWDRLRRLPETSQKLVFAYDTALSAVRADVGGHAHRLATQMARIAGAADRIQQRLGHALAHVGHRIGHLRDAVERHDRFLASVSPERQLRLGYSIVTDGAGSVIRDAAQLKPGHAVRTRLARGAFVSEVKELSSE
ncbi:MAG TPA: exodeoxyribonuclease VII large subunit [Candidatus Paceibacterota bacterium]|nr:exodeoxyribonuclease VII large subunit [Candidatus Paceibacterota bacterium]